MSDIEGTKTIYEYGIYRIDVSAPDGYYVVNKDTGVNEEATPKLWEAIRFCKVNDLYYREMLNWVPSSFGRVPVDDDDEDDDGHKLN